MVFADALAWIAHNPGEFLSALRQHLLMCAIALMAALAIGLPAAVLIRGRERLAAILINGISGLRTVPSLAILALMLPLLGIGLGPSVVALTILALPPIVINAYVGLNGVDADVLDAAAGMGMEPGQILWRIQLPLAAPAIFGGIRTALVQVLAGATLAPFIGGGGLGDFITVGVSLGDMPRLLVGAVPIALLALTSEAIMAGAQRLAFGAGSQR